MPLPCRNFGLRYLRAYNGGTVFEPWMEAALKAVDEAQYNRADVIAATDGLTSISAVARDAWQQRRAERGMRAYGILLGTREGMHALASIADAVLTIDNLQDDMPILQTILAHVGLEVKGIIMARKKSAVTCLRLCAHSKMALY